MLCSRLKPISRADVFYSAASLRRTLRKRSAPRAWRYRLLCGNSSDSIQAVKCSAKTLLILRKSFNANDPIFRTVEDGLKLWAKDGVTDYTSHARSRSHLQIFPTARGSNGIKIAGQGLGPPFRLVRTTSEE